ncbi:phospholipase D-like domain-containing protein [Sphingomonas sp. RB56-2]|uniref:Phospholipase D n=1 Tax=Sphingomonas brevis TaxID=2908206 RepID=A0ABT0S5P1_9SPHN|nr:phospholipase D-like domain-containing protein [Sphingomonas brevis]
MPDRSPRVLFGGPGEPPRLLRNDLQERVEAVPAGGKIAWSTYYFRDRALAQSLIEASDRGVMVTLRIEGDPRFPEVNEAVIAMLEQHGLGGGLKIHRPPHRWPERRYGYWHSKIYCFSHPVPTALIGSFNPSGDEPEDEGILASIGDQDRGHNLLVAFEGNRAFLALGKRVRQIGGRFARFDPLQNRPIRLGASTVWTYPRLWPGLIDHQLKSLGRGDRVRGAISHLKHGRLAEQLAAGAKRGVSIELLLHDTERRVPEEVVAELAAAGVIARRYARPDSLPLHSKFLIVDEGGSRNAWFGSFNYNQRSYRHNHEVLVETRDPNILCALVDRFDEIAAEVGRSR